MSLNISVCVIIVEMIEENNSENNPSGSFAQMGAMATSDSTLVNGRRESREITVETYARESKSSVKALFPRSKRSGYENDLLLQKTASSESQSEDLLEPDSLSFVSGNPFVETTRGILHLYKEDCLSTLESGSERCDTVCILAVPAAMTCHDLLTFTAACHEDIKHLRIVKDGTPNQYMALLTFRSQKMAYEFFVSFNGIPFNSLEPDCICHLVFVSAIEVEETNVQTPSGHIELPTCPVCLERMDESVDGILTILCNHTFHSNCLAKWGDTSCPVCRYIQTPELVADNRCLQCHSAENLWICLICGHVGCGRYVEGHAYKHYLTTQHCYSMQLGSNRVWDYAGDNFVHRLMQNKGDGKLVEGEQPSKETGVDEKMDSMQLEWTYNLTMQLEKQREYFEDKLSRLQQSLTNDSSEMKQKMSKSLDENKHLQKKLEVCNHEKQHLEKKVSVLSSKLNSALCQLQDERQMNRSLTQNQIEWESKVQKLEKQFGEYKGEKEKELADLKDQLRDIMFFLEAKNKIDASENRDEIAEGSITVGEPPQTTNTSGAKGRRRKHR